MMKVVAMGLAVAICVPSFGQLPDTVRLGSQEDYQRKSEEQQHLAKVFLIGGSAMMFIGMIGFNNSSGPSDTGAADIYGYMFVGGSLLDLASVPLFISSSKNAKKATAAIGISNQRIPGPGTDRRFFNPCPSLTLTLRLR